MKRERLLSGVLLVVGLVSALLGQVYFAHRREFVWDGVFIWCVALVAFGVLVWRMQHPERARRRDGEGMAGGVWRKPAVGLGIILVLVAAWLARGRPEGEGFGDLLWLWMAGSGLFLAAFCPLPNLARVAAWVRAHRFELLGLGGLLLLALALRAIDLAHVPANLGGDEGTQGVAALELLEPPLGNPFSTGWFAVPTMSFLWYGVSMRLLGSGVAGLRALSALAGTATVLVTFLMARDLWGRRVGWLAAGVLTCAHFHVHFSRLGSNQVIDGLFASLALWLLVRGLRSGRAFPFVLSGAVTGLGWYGYFGARLIGVVVGVYLAWRFVVTYRFWPRYGRLLLLWLLAAILVMTPLLFHFGSQPHRLAARSKQVNIFTSDWLRNEQEITGRSATRLMLEQLWKSISAFNYTLDPTFWYHPAIPLLDWISGLFFILGLVWAMAYFRWPANGLLLAWFWLAVTLGWVMTENPPSSMRLAGIAPALAMLVGVGIDWVLDLGTRLLGGDRRWWLGGVALVLVLIAVLNVQYYFFVYTPTRVYGNPTAEIATVLGRYLAAQEDGGFVCFHAPPVMYWDFGTLRFLARSVDGMDAAGDTCLAPGPGRGTRFVFLPHRLAELEAVRSRHPGGRETQVFSDGDGRLLYVLYEIGPR